MNATTIAKNILETNLSRDDLNRIINAINTKNRMLAMVAQAAFSKGDKVEFVNRRNGLTVKGKVVSIMVKNIKVLSDQGVTWTVSPQLLRASA